MGAITMRATNNTQINIVTYFIPTVSYIDHDHHARWYADEGR